jgi:hypothetical protein
LKAAGLVDGHAPPDGCQLVVAARLAVVAGDPIRGLLDEPILDEPVERPVEGAGAHANRAVAQLRHPPDQRVAVSLALEQREHELEGCGGEGLHSSRHART